MTPDPRSVALSLVVPAVILVLGTIVLGPSGAVVLGVPAIYLLIFCLFPLTSALMFISWRLWDRHAEYDGHETEVR